MSMSRLLNRLIVAILALAIVAPVLPVRAADQFVKSSASGGDTATHKDKQKKKHKKKKHKKKHHKAKAHHKRKHRRHRHHKRRHHRRSTTQPRK